MAGRQCRPATHEPRRRGRAATQTHVGRRD